MSLFQTIYYFVMSWSLIDLIVCELYQAITLQIGFLHLDVFLLLLVTNRVMDGYINKCGNYALKDGTLVKIMPVNHAWVGYSWDYLHKVISAFLSL